MKIIESYMIFKENGEIKKNYFTTSGQAYCNKYGCISVKNQIETLKELIKRMKENDKETNVLLDKWEKTPIEKKNFYTEKYKELNEVNSNIYESYYNLVYTILTNEEVEKLQKQIKYNFMSNLFINKMTELLESKEV